MAKIKNTELNKFNKAIEKVGADVTEMSGAIIKLEGLRTELEKAKGLINNEVTEMLADNTKMDAMEYLSKKQQLQDYDKQIKDVSQEIADLKGNIEGVEADLNDKVYREFLESGAIRSEFDNNILEMQKEVFKLLCEAEAKMNDIEAEGIKYKESTNNLNHSKTQYYTFDTHAPIKRLMLRFGLRDNKIKYSTAISGELENFEY